MKQTFQQSTIFTMKVQQLLLCFALTTIFVNAVPEQTTYDNGNPPVTNDPLCSEDGTYFLPKPDSCEFFFECVNGDKYLFKCPPGLHFNPSISECDYPENAGCETKKRNGVRSEEEPGKPPIVNDPACPEEGVTYLVDETNCSIYYECVDGNKFEFVCPAGLHFNLELSTCDFPSHAHCNVEREQFRARAVQFNVQRDDEEEPTPAPPEYDEEVCAKDEVYFVRDEEDCSVYYECVNHYKYTFKCPADLYFNIEKETCDHRKNVDCPASN